MKRLETPLARILKDRIRSEGPMTFRDFMSSALYDDRSGFYAQGPEIGSPEGPFDTNAKFRAFGFALTQAIEKAQRILARELAILELGAGTGQLAENLKACQPCRREYVIFEPSAGLRAMQESKGLKTEGAWEKIPAGPMFAFGNEVLDALPVHRVMGMGPDHVVELYVNLDDNEEFFEDPGPLSTPKLKDRLDQERINLGRGQVAEICLEFSGLLKNLRRIINPGFLCFVDYGDRVSNLYSHHHRNGTLRTYFRQQQIHDVFYAVGQQDLTADVDFTAVIAEAEQVGWELSGCLPQGQWLKNVGIENYVGTGTHVVADRQEIEILTGSASLGSAFNVLMFQTPGLSCAPGF